MLYSRNNQYAFRALAFLAEREGDGVFSTAEIARSEKVGVPSLAKVMKVLARARLVEAGRGRRGGYRLVRDPRRIFLWDVVCEFDDPFAFSSCGIGLGFCDSSNPCALHPNWRKARAAIERFLKGVSIADLARQRRSAAAARIRRRKGRRRISRRGSFTAGTS